MKRQEQVEVVRKRFICVGGGRVAWMVGSDTAGTLQLRKLRSAANDSDDKAAWQAWTQLYRRIGSSLRGWASPCGA